MLPGVNARYKSLYLLNVKQKSIYVSIDITAHHKIQCINRYVRLVEESHIERIHTVGKLCIGQLLCQSKNSLVQPLTF